MGGHAKTPLLSVYQITSVQGEYPRGLSGPYHPVPAQLPPLDKGFIKGNNQRELSFKMI